MEFVKRHEGQHWAHSIYCTFGISVVRAFEEKACCKIIWALHVYIGIDLVSEFSRLYSNQSIMYEHGFSFH